MEHKLKFYSSVMEVSLTLSIFWLSEMSSVPISKAYVSKRSNRVKNNPKWPYIFHNQIEENSSSRLSPPESRKHSVNFGSDYKISVLWDRSAVRLYVEARKCWDGKFLSLFWISGFAWLQIRL